jgi:hypothetical protein
MGTNYYGGNVAGDYIHNKNNLRYSEWRKIFAFFPKRTEGGKRVWLTFLYRRRRWLHIEPPQFPRSSFDKIEYATWEEVVRFKLTGRWT